MLRHDVIVVAFVRVLQQVEPEAFSGSESSMKTAELSFCRSSLLSPRGKISHVDIGSEVA